MDDPDAASLAQGRYRLVEPLGEGGMATVWKGWDQRLRIWRAIKVLSPTLRDSRTLRRRFTNEAQTMARLHHPNIVAVHDVGEDGQRPYLVMELVDGGSLQDWLEDHGPMPPRLAVEAVIAVVEALRLAHEEGVVHRDIKPQNVLVTSKGVPKVTDFGIARLTEDRPQVPLTRTGSVMGTWGFMAPEQRTSARRVDARADLYSVGATLFTLLTAELPVDLFAAEIDDELLGQLPSQLRSVVSRCTRYRPRERYPDADSLLEDLRRLLEVLEASPEDTPALGRVRTVVGGEPAGSALERMTPSAQETIFLDEEPGAGTLVPPSASPGAGGDEAEQGGTLIPEVSTPPLGSPTTAGAGANAASTSSSVTTTPTATTTARRGATVAMFALAAVVVLTVRPWTAVQGPEPVDPAVLNEAPAVPPDGAGGPPEEEDAPGAAGSPLDAEPSATSPEPTRASPEPMKASPGPPAASPSSAAMRPVAPSKNVELTGSEPVSSSSPPEPREGVDDRAAEADPGEGETGEGVEAGPEADQAWRQARVSVSGDAEAVILVDGRGRRFSPGPLPPGDYTVRARFDSDVEIIAGRISLAEGASITLTCDGAFLICKERR